ncbi:MAG: ferrochelatase, partial [Myxococcales bacterium]
VFRVAGQRWVTPTLSFIEPFYDEPVFIDAFAAQGRGLLAAEQADADADHVLFSFHGLPERHMRKADDTGAHCLVSESCCDRMVPANRHCYRAQCFATARALAGRLGLGAGTFSVTFQSRLGRTPWIRPYTDVALLQLAAQGKKRLVVFCPAFVADCLETLEEIGIRAQHDFVAAGGERLTLVPSLNASPPWVEAIVALVRRQAERFGAGAGTTGGVNNGDPLP